MVLAFYSYIASIHWRLFRETFCYYTVQSRYHPQLKICLQWNCTVTELPAVRTTTWNGLTYPNGIHKHTLSHRATRRIHKHTLSPRATRSNRRNTLSHRATRSIHKHTLSHRATRSIHKHTLSHRATRSTERRTRHRAFTGQSLGLDTADDEFRSKPTWTT